jgi:hypothetical protein
LVSSAFSRIFYLPFQTGDKEDQNVSHRVIWYGTVNENSKTFSLSPSGPDSICFAYGFCILIEATLRGNVRDQWRREFVESLKHYDDFIRDNNKEKRDVYLILVAPEFNKDTYAGFQQKAREGYNIVLLESSCIAKIGEISKISFTVGHLDLRILFNKLVKKFRESTSFDKLKIEFSKSISEWGKDVFKNEKPVFFGLKAFEAMKKINRNVVGISEILLKLNRDNQFKSYMKVLGGGDLTSYIKDGLLYVKLACLVETPDEDHFCRTNSLDFEARGLKLIEKVKGINGKL